MSNRRIISRLGDKLFSPLNGENNVCFTLSYLRCFETLIDLEQTDRYTKAVFKNLLFEIFPERKIDGFI